MSFNAAWTYNDLATWLCDALVQRGRLRTKPAFIREDREGQIAALFEAIQLDGAALAGYVLSRGIPQLEIRVREATRGEAWVADVFEILTAIGTASNRVLPAVTTPSPSAWPNLLQNSVLPNPLFPPGWVFNAHVNAHSAHAWPPISTTENVMHNFGGQGQQTNFFEAFFKFYAAMGEMHVNSSCNAKLITNMPVVHNLAGETLSPLTSVLAPLMGREVRRQVAVASGVRPEQCVLLDGCQQIKDCDEINVDECVSLTFISKHNTFVKLCVEGLKFQYVLTEDDVHLVMSRYGVVSSVEVEDGGVNAIVEFAETDAAIFARDDLQGRVLYGLDAYLCAESI